MVIPADFAQCDNRTGHWHPHIGRDANRDLRVIGPMAKSMPENRYAVFSTGTLGFPQDEAGYRAQESRSAAHWTSAQPL